jgi:hypothetical protein
VQHLPREQWHAFVADAHPAYISWEEYEQISGAWGKCSCSGERTRKGPAREGPALLQVSSFADAAVAHDGPLSLAPRWSGTGLCLSTERLENAESICQRVPRAEIDRFIGAVLVEFINPITLDWRWLYIRNCTNN